MAHHDPVSHPLIGDVIRLRWEGLVPHVDILDLYGLIRLLDPADAGSTPAAS